MQLGGCDKLIQEIADGKMVMGEVGSDVLISVCVMFFDAKLCHDNWVEKMLLPGGLPSN